MSHDQAKRPKFGVFAEGPRPTDPESIKKSFQDLWRNLCASCGYNADIRVYGFSKKNIILLSQPTNQPRTGWSDEPLDILIKRMHERDGFQNAIIAFDRWPPNDEIKSKPFCLRTEVNFVLEAILRRRLLPESFLASASALLTRYKEARGQPRQSAQIPYGSLEFIFMDPNFESLLIHDELAVLRALELERRPKDWPKFDPHSQEPGQYILQPAIECAARHRRKGLLSFKTDKHGWALKVVRAAAQGSRLWEHNIPRRLSTLLT